MSRAYCECPCCTRKFPVKWGFETLGITRVGEEDGAVLTDSDDMYATRVVYLRSVRCPHCGTHMRVEHELVPRFFAIKEDSNAD